MSSVVLRRTGIALGLAIAIALAIGVALAGSENVPPPAQIPIELFGGRAVGQRITTRSWSIEYRKLEASADGSMIDVDGVHDALLYRKGKPYLRLRAQHLSVNNVTKDFTVTGALHAETLGGTPRTFDTVDATWTSFDQRLTMKHRVVVHTGDQTLTIDGLTVNVKTGDAHLGPISGGIRR